MTIPQALQAVEVATAIGLAWIIGCIATMAIAWALEQMGVGW